MSLPVIVLGGGGHAKVLIDALMLSSVEVLGVTDSNPAMIGLNVLGKVVIGTDDEVLCYGPEKIRLINGLGSIARPGARRRLFEKFKESGYSFASVCHPSAAVAADVIVGEGSQIMAGAVVQPGAHLGANTIINTRASVDHDCRIGDHAHLAPGVTLSGQVTVGEGAHIGTGSTVIQSVRIGNDSLVGAGSLVLNNIDAGVKAFGCPAKIVKK